MPSIIPGYEYDIFISYRQKDNKQDGWVTEFINSLKNEIEATFKEDISIYFDENPFDGLGETHDVDDSLAKKLKCLIFIPIISKTYCDPNSFAWTNEFLAFNELASNDEHGLKVNLPNGNTASRVLPVRIHDIDEEDKRLIEDEIGFLRSIDFVYKEPGVNRPLSPDDSEEKNLESTKYRNQINKVANAIQEITAGLKNVGTQTNVKEVSSSTSTTVAPSVETKPKGRSKALIASIGLILILTIVYFFYKNQNQNEVIVGLDHKSIAVLPFVDLSPEGDQEYLGDGIAEEIINVLTKIEGLKVIGRTSSFSFKGQNTDLMTIGNKLGVGTILEGSVRKSNNIIRITAQLINAEDGSHLWSETFERELEDIFALQDDISTWIVDKFKLTLTLSREEFPPTTNIDAYEMFLRGRQSFAKGMV